MIDDPRIKRVLKRYRKEENVSDASIEVTALGDSELLLACRCTGELSLAGPRELDDHALSHLSRLTGIAFDRDEFDYYLHSYVRSEFVSTYFDDPTVGARPAPEDGPPLVPLPSGTRWRSVRPKDGKEQFQAWEFREDSSK